MSNVISRRLAAVAYGSGERERDRVTADRLPAGLLADATQAAVVSCSFGEGLWDSAEPATRS